MNYIKSSVIPFAVCLLLFFRGVEGGRGSFILSIIMFNLVLMTLAPKQVLLLLNCMTVQKKGEKKGSKILM